MNDLEMSNVIMTISSLGVFADRLLKPSFSLEQNLVYTIKDEVLEFWALG